MATLPLIIPGYVLQPVDLRLSMLETNMNVPSFITVEKTLDYSYNLIFKPSDSDSGDYKIMITLIDSQYNTKSVYSTIVQVGHSS